MQYTYDYVSQVGKILTEKDNNWKNCYVPARSFHGNLELISFVNLSFTRAPCLETGVHGYDKARVFSSQSDWLSARCRLPSRCNAFGAEQ